MFSAKASVSKEDIERGYAKHPSITDYLPWLDYSDEHQVFLLEDQRSVAVALSIKPVACEARPAEQMQATQQAISEALKNAIPLEKTDPWIVQVMVQRDNHLHGVIDQIKHSVQQHDTPTLTDAHLQTLQQHLDYLTQPDEADRPYGWDLAESVFFTAPESFSDGWLFDGLPHKVLTIQSLSQVPEIGHLTAERPCLVDDKIFVLIDHLPEHSILVMNIVFQALSETEAYLQKIANSAVGHHALAVKIHEQLEAANHAIVHGDVLLPLTMALYIRADDLDHLPHVESQAEVLLNSHGFKVITDCEVFPIDAYLRYLPMCYDYGFDRHNSFRSRYCRLSDIAKLLPFYGRSTGTDHPGMLMFNRGGEPWYYDVLRDKSKNAHFLLLGETGTGKSNTLNFLAMHMLALYNPRLFIIEAGGSFDLLATYCQSLGLTVNHVKIDLKHPVSLNPFAHGLNVLNQSDNDERDVLGDMVLAVLIMITGGEHKEEDRITRADRMLIMDAILLAAQTVKGRGEDSMIASDVIQAFEQLAQSEDNHARALEMANGMRYLTQDPVSSRFFNTSGEPWPLADITLVDFGLFAQEGYEAQRSIAFAGCVHKMLALADANQRSGRAIIAMFDENHLFSKLPLLAAIQTRIAKMGRKLGLWLWISTQNLKDFSDEAHKMLSLIETWMCLALPPDEIDQIERFKPLTPEQRALFLSAKKKSKASTPKACCSVLNCKVCFATCRLSCIWRWPPPIKMKNTNGNSCNS